MVDRLPALFLHDVWCGRLVAGRAGEAQGIQALWLGVHRTLAGSSQSGGICAHIRFSFPRPTRDSAWHDSASATFTVLEPHPAASFLFLLGGRPKVPASFSGLTQLTYPRLGTVRPRQHLVGASALPGWSRLSRGFRHVDCGGLELASNPQSRRAQVGNAVLIRHLQGHGIQPPSTSVGIGRRGGVWRGDGVVQPVGAPHMMAPIRRRIVRVFLSSHA